MTVLAFSLRHPHEANGMTDAPRTEISRRRPLPADTDAAAQPLTASGVPDRPASSPVATDAGAASAYSSLPASRLAPPALPPYTPATGSLRADSLLAALTTECAHAPELDEYRDEPGQMPSGSVGKRGYLRLGFCRQGDRSILAELDRRVPFLAQQALYWDEALPDLPCVFLITTSGCLLQGDRMALDIAVGPDARAHITTQSATKIHSMDANFAAQIQHIHVARGGYLELLPDALLPHRHSRFFSTTHISLEDDASLLYSELLLPGRKYHHPDERFGLDLYAAGVTVHQDNSPSPLYSEKFLLRPRQDPLSALGAMHTFDVFGSALIFSSAEHCRHILDAAGVHVGSDMAYGASLLPHHRGLAFKVLGHDAPRVRRILRRFWELSRQTITGASLPAEFLWRQPLVTPECAS